MGRKQLALICLTVLAVAASAPVPACHLPDYLRLEELDLTPQQLAILAHHGATFEQIPYQLDAAAPCIDGVADIFPCQNVNLLSYLSLSDIGGGNGNDMWGWEDPLTGVEYALVGRSNGTAFVDLSDPENPVYVGNLPTHASSSTWRDIKVYEDHAFIVADFAGDHGMQVFDLSQLRDVVSPPATFSETAHYPGFERAHNIVVNEDTGRAYAVGSETCSGGLHIVDIGDPLLPAFAGCFSSDGYTHDAQCVAYAGPDTEHIGSEVCFASNEDTVTIVDVTDAASPTQLSRAGYSGAGYTHQGWLTEDQRYFIHDDELDELFFGHLTRTYVWDVQDLDNPSLVGFYQAQGAAIDHNQYIDGGYTYQANYRRGLRVLSLDDPSTAALSEAAYFDTYPESDGESFEGAWSTYPFFDSGIVLVSDINRGLFVLQPELEKLTVGGTCPGTFSLDISGQTPDAQVVVMRGRQLAPFVLPVGPCAGTEVGIDQARRLATLATDSSGNATFERSVGPGVCGSYVQVVDLSTCQVTNVGQLP